MARAWHLASRPHGMPTHANFEMKDLPSAPLGEGEVRVRNMWLSVDPYMRGRMNDVKSYVPPFALDAPLEGGAVGQHPQGLEGSPALVAQGGVEGGQATARGREVTVEGGLGVDARSLGRLSRRAGSRRRCR